MKSFIIALLLLSCASVSAQYVFIIPTHYHGLFTDQLSSARAQAMGYTTITTEGIGTSIYNPATISPGNSYAELAFNYAKGHPYHPKAYNSFVGASFRVLPKLVVGASSFSWVDPDTYWNTTIANQNIETSRKSLHMHSVTAAYELINGLHLGASGNFIRQKYVEKTTTAEEFIMNAGVLYDRTVSLINNPSATNQQIRFALSMTNILMNAKTEQRYENLLNYRDMPVILRVGTGFRFSIPLSAAFARKSKYFSNSPELLDLSLRLQYQDFLKHKDHIFNDHKYSNAFGIGAEAWFMRLLALRLGYYTEKRATDEDADELLATTNRKAGLTWGFGANIPVQRLSGGRIPVEMEANFVTSKMMDELVDENSTRVSPEFRDKRFQFCVGLNVRWNRKK